MIWSVSSNYKAARAAAHLILDLAPNTNNEGLERELVLEVGHLARPCGPRAQGPRPASLRKAKWHEGNSQDGLASVETNLANRCCYRVAVWPTERLPGRVASY